jgi:hypothetical protein
VPTADELDQILQVASSPAEVDYFFEELKSAAWIPALRQRGMFSAPPGRVDDAEGAFWFPGWSRSRYLARVASEDPGAVAPLLRDLEAAENPRIWRDILAALAAMPPAYSVRFLPRFDRWIHSPFQVGAEEEAAKIAAAFLDAAMVSEALAVLATFAAIAPPSGIPTDELWEPIRDWEYKRQLPNLAARLAGVTMETIWVLANAFDAAYEAKADDSADYSSLWRPAIESHPQNWGHRERPDALVDCLRDSAIARVDQAPGELGAIVEGLLARGPSILARIGLHVLVERGSLDLALAGSILTTKSLFSNTEFHHEFWHLARAWFAQIAPADQTRYLELVDEVASEKAERQENADEASGTARAWTFMRLSPIAEHLADGAKERYEEIAADRGTGGIPPDFLSWHESWSGPTSPLSVAEIEGLSLDALEERLRTWTDPDGFRPGPSAEGLARELQRAATNDPLRFAPFATRLIDLPPVYAGWFLMGLRDALKTEVEFDVRPAIALCHTIVERSAAELDADPLSDRTWRSSRIDAARFIEEALARRRLLDDDDGTVWATITQLLTDPEPAPDSDAYGDPLTQSLNTTRGQAVNAALAFAWWTWRRSPDHAAFRLPEAAPAVADALAAHISELGDPSHAIGAAFGWWLEYLVAIDAEWTREHAPGLLGDLSTKRQRVAWEAFLMRSGPGTRSFEVLRPFYDRYAELLAERQGAPDDKRGLADPVDRFLSHIVLLELRHDLPGEGGPLHVVLASGKPWLLKELVQIAGRIAHDSEQIAPEIADLFRGLWERINAAVDAANDAVLRAALGEFSWWFASKLPAEWTLPELVRLLDTGVSVDPEFLVLPRLAELAAGYEELTLRALEKMVPKSDHDWAFRSREDDVREVLRVALASDDGLRRERAGLLINRFGRLGMVGLGSLLTNPGTGAAPEG